MKLFPNWERSFLEWLQGISVQTEGRWKKIAIFHWVELPCSSGLHLKYTWSRRLSGRVGSTYLGLAQRQHLPSQCFMVQIPTHLAMAGRALEGTCRPWGLNSVVQEGCRPCLQPRHGTSIFPCTPSRGHPPLPSFARQLICTWSWCPRSACFGLFIYSNRLCCLLPPQANRFAKLPRYTNFVWQLTSLADEFCHHPSPELISLPLLQS